MRSGLEVRFWWGDHLVGEHFLRGGVDRSLFVGAGDEVDFPLSFSGLGARSHQLVRCTRESAPTVHFTEAMTGTLHRPGAPPMPLTEVCQHLAERDDHATWGLTLTAGETLALELGPVTAEVRHRPTPRAVHVPLGDTADFTFANIVLGCLAVAMLFIITAINHASAGELSDDDWSKEETRIVKLLTTTYTPVKLKPTKTPTIDNSSPTASTTPVSKPSPARVAARPAAGAAAVINQLRAGGGIASLIGPSGLGDELGRAMGGLQVAARLGEPGGDLNLRGTRGGQPSQVIGVDGIRIKAGGPGGLNPALTLTPNRGPKIEIEPPIVDPGGNLDPELIRAVIHANHGQLRYCYEHLLTQYPSLAGKVAVHFVISGDGTVSASNVQRSTTSNTKLDSCVVGRVRTWRFPRPKGGGIAVVTYPFLFKQSGQ